MTSTQSMDRSERWTRLREEVRDLVQSADLSELIEARWTAEAADDAVRFLVGEAREAGASWSEIGEGLGVTKQAAHQRFGR